jgi:biotin-(acetyl-CoA carboxylase) ligase
MKFLLIALAAFSLLSLSVNIPATIATQQLFCRGRMNNGWSIRQNFSMDVLNAFAGRVPVNLPKFLVLVLKILTTKDNRFIVAVYSPQSV